MEDLHKKAVDLLNRYKSYIDTPNSPGGVSLRNEIQRLEDEVQAKKNKSSLEARAKNVIRILDNTDESVMDHNHIDDLRDRCFDLIQDIRKM